MASVMAASSPVAIVCVGMAGKYVFPFWFRCKLHVLTSICCRTGSGKTTFMQRINSYLHSKREPPYVINLDPAVLKVPFESNIDIRDSLNYKEVMREYNLGPNGGILTSLNIFATKIDQVMSILEKRTSPGADIPRAQPIKNIIVDTPGQIEVFVWSASGSILLDSFASTYPTVIAYIIDTPRTSSTSTFMSNMLYACSILYKTKLPMILVFNKTDVTDAEFAKEWMTDFEAFQAALRQEEASGSFGGVEGGNGGLGGGSGYMGSLLNSMSLMLEEFYRHLSVVGVSSMTGKGIPEFFEAVDDKAEEFKRDYLPELEKRRRARQSEKQNRKEEELGKLMKDMNIAVPIRKTPSGLEKVQDAKRLDVDTISDAEDELGSDVEAQMVEPDEEGKEDGDYEEQGPANGELSQRYTDALGAEGGLQKGLSSDDHSFTRYLRASQMSRADLQ
jgi:GPN-loop GTPase